MFIGSPCSRAVYSRKIVRWIIFVDFIFSYHRLLNRHVYTVHISDKSHYRIWMIYFSNQTQIHTRADARTHTHIWWITHVYNYVCICNHADATRCFRTMTNNRVSQLGLVSNEQTEDVNSNSSSDATNQPDPVIVYETDPEERRGPIVSFQIARRPVMQRSMSLGTRRSSLELE